MLRVVPEYGAMSLRVGKIQMLSCMVTFVEISSGDTIDRYSAALRGFVLVRLIFTVLVPILTQALLLYWQLVGISLALMLPGQYLLQPTFSIRMGLILRG